MENMNISLPHGFEAMSIESLKNITYGPFRLRKGDIFKVLAPCSKQMPNGLPMPFVIIRLAEGREECVTLNSIVRGLTLGEGRLPYRNAYEAVIDLCKHTLECVAVEERPKPLFDSDGRPIPGTSRMVEVPVFRLLH